MSLSACEICSNSFCDSSGYCVKGDSSFSDELRLHFGAAEFYTEDLYLQHAIVN